MATRPCIRSTESYRGNVNPIGPRACYDEGKRCAETLFFDYYRQHNLQIRVARIFNTYGPRMHPNDGRVVSNFIVQALQNEPITLYGDGTQTRAFCYVDDLIDGFVRADGRVRRRHRADQSRQPGRNLGRRARRPRSSRLTGSRSTIVRRPLPVDDPMQRCPDIAQARGGAGLAAAHRLKDGLDAHHRLFRQASLHAGAQTRSRPASERDIAGQRGNRGKLTRASRGVAEPIAVG